MTTILWLRRDLRFYDHAALSAALTYEGDVQPVFIFDTDILARFPHKHDRRLTFLVHTLCTLQSELQKRGGHLLVFYGRAVDILPALSKEWNARIVASEDYEPNAIKRDHVVAQRAPLVLVKDQLIFSPLEVLKNDSTPFKVFTPFSRAWRTRLSPSDYGEYKLPDNGRYARNLSTPLKTIALEAGVEAVLAHMGYHAVDISHWPVMGARERLRTFMREKAAGYSHTRNMLAMEGTSQLSPYLRFGLVSVREVVRLALEHAKAEQFLSELIWREFYAMILFHYPHSVDSEWNERFRGLGWSHNSMHLEAWKEGRTGFPIIDAAMRELLTTGWMHNRARMIVASFLTKDLQIDWRLGEEYFSQHLMDYELASNVGGWQWSASTGTDAQPWFRIFNPYLQSEKFDPDGDYIRRFVPELAHIKGKNIHNPTPLDRGDYPAPMVDHSEARKKTLTMFKAHEAAARYILALP